ncbi:hypothetical protein PCASD_07239 [Puccinia coronata f. sp. avenae]|uniref:Uncharacterized protein n=1 Tax=Puccinia coronata f. sp. avenae TaxID=200324 RepID=A0A2N5UYP4_9BASI|nr:hypothetical protein PCASD_07239 [Puccinia coronata f. sp. avenae]
MTDVCLVQTRNPALPASSVGWCGHLHSLMVLGPFGRPFWLPGGYVFTSSSPTEFKLMIKWLPDTGVRSPNSEVD